MRFLDLYFCALTGKIYRRIVVYCVSMNRKNEYLPKVIPVFLSSLLLFSNVAIANQDKVNLLICNNELDTNKEQCSNNSLEKYSSSFRAIESIPLAIVIMLTMFLIYLLYNIVMIILLILKLMTLQVQEVINNISKSKQ